jgi:hypothetical protein
MTNMDGLDIRDVAKEKPLLGNGHRGLGSGNIPQTFSAQIRRASSAAKHSHMLPLVSKWLGLR